TRPKATSPRSCSRDRIFGLARLRLRSARPRRWRFPRRLPSGARWASMTAIVVDGLSKHFRLNTDRAYSVKERVLKLGRTTHENFWALRDISLTVDEGETVGILGHNGSGKSTLLKCIAGILKPSIGTVRQKGRIASLLELGAGFHPDLTGRENVYINASFLG